MGSPREGVVATVASPLLLVADGARKEGAIQPSRNNDAVAIAIDVGGGSTKSGTACRRRKRRSCCINPATGENECSYVCIKDELL